jgi:hypothetical protein
MQCLYLSVLRHNFKISQSLIFTYDYSNDCHLFINFPIWLS